MQLFAIGLLLTLLYSSTVPTSAAEVFYENSCNRTYGIPGYFTQGDGSDSECIESCSIQGKSLSLLYQSLFCFCGDSVCEECGEGDSIPTLTTGPIWPCTNETANSYFLMKQTYLPPNFIFEITQESRYTVSLGLTEDPAENTNGIIVEVYSSDDMSNVLYPPNLHMFSFASFESTYLLRTINEVEVDLYAYRENFMESPYGQAPLQGNPMDCVLSGHCQRETGVVPKRHLGLLDTVKVSCDEHAWVNETFTCQVTVYGEALTLDVDFGDGLAESLHSQVNILDSAEVVIGYTDTEKYFSDASEIDIDRTDSEYSYRLTHRLINDHAYIHSVEYSYADVGTFEFSILQPVCTDQFYCHKSVQCTADEKACDAMSIYSESCPSGSIWSLSQRECVETTDGSGRLGKPKYKTLLTPSVSYEVVHTLSIDMSQSGLPANVSIFHKLEDFIEVKPGDVIAIEVTAGNLFMAEIPEGDTISCMYQQTNAIHCTHEPLVAAHMYTASIFTVSHTYLEDCKDFTFQVDVSVDSVLTNTTTQTIRPLSRLSNVTLTSPTAYGITPYPGRGIFHGGPALNADEEDGMIIVATNESAEVLVPWHPAYCDSKYYWLWGDDASSDYELTNAKNNSHKYTEPGTYNITLLTETEGINTTTIRGVLVETKIAGFSLDGMAPANVFGESTSFSVSLTEGTQVMISFDSGSEFTDTLEHTSPSTQIDYTYPDPGYYLIAVTVSNFVSNQSLESWVAVEKKIEGLAISSDLIPYNMDTPEAVAVTLTDGTRVNFTCDIEGSPCVDWDVDWQSNGGVVTFGPGNTNGPGTYLLTLTAVNMVTSLVSISSPIDVLREITNPSTVVMGNGVAGNFLVEPLHTIEFIVSLDEGSRVTLKVTCDGGYENETYVEDIVDGDMTVSIEFTTDDVYECDVALTSPIGSNFSETYTFTVQYPIKDVDFGLADFVTANDPVYKDAVTLAFPTYSETLAFILVRSTQTNLPTNCSWSIDFGNGIIETSQEFLTEAGELSPSFALIKAFTHTYTEGGNYTITLTLTNDITGDYTISYDVVVYEEISGVTIANIFHIDEAGNTWPSYPNQGKNSYSYVLHESITDPHYQYEETLLFEGAVTRGSHMTWSWNFGSGDVVTGSDCNTTEYSYFDKVDPGTYQVNLTVSNAISFVTVYQEIVLQRSVKDVQLMTPPEITFAINTSVSFVLHGSDATDVCYLIDFKDPLAEKSFYAQSQDNLCSKMFSSLYEMATPGTFDPLIDADSTSNISMKFMTLGQYMIQYYIVNVVSYGVFSHKVGITTGPCEFPIVFMPEHNCTGCNEFYKSAAININAVVKTDCRGSTTGFSWTWYQVNDDGSETLRDLDGIKHTSALTGLHIEPRELDYGVHRFQLNVSMEREVGIFTTNSLDIIVKQSDLIAQFTEGPVISLKHGSMLTLDASLSYDPDEGADSSSSTGLSFVWLCHRECEQLPEYDSDWQETSQYCSEYKAENPNNKGCFYNDSYFSPGLFTDSSNSVIDVSTEDSYELEVIYFTIHVSKGNRSATAEVLVDLLQGDPPQFQLVCRINCKGKTNTDLKFSFTSVLRNGLPSDHDYQWKAYNATEGNINWSKNPSPLNIKETDLANTGLNDRNLAFVPLSFLALNSSIRTVALTLTIKNQRTNASGWQMFYVEFNTPPIPKENGCSISPANGTAGVTEFSVFCDDDAFIDEDSPFKYEYFSSFTKTGSRIPVHGKKSTSMEALNNFQLPFGKKNSNYTIFVVVRCYDFYGSSSELVMSVRVIPENKPLEGLVEDVSNQLEDMSLLLESGQTDAVFGKLMLITTVVNDVDGRSELDESLKELYGNKSSAASSNSEEAVTISPEEQEKLTQQKQELKTNGIKLVANTFPVSGTEDMIKVALLIGGFTQVSGEVSDEGLVMSTNKVEDVVNKLATDAENLEYADLLEVVKNSLPVLGNLMACSNTIATKAYQDGQEENIRKKRSTSVNEGTGGSMVILDKISHILSTTVVEGETPDQKSSEKLSLSVSKSVGDQLSDSMATSDGVSMKLTSASTALGLSGNDSVNTVISSFTNPFFTPTDLANTIKSNTVRLLFKDENGTALQPDAVNSSFANNLFIPIADPQPPKLVIGTAGSGSLGTIRKITLSAGKSLSLQISPFLAKVDNTAANNSSNLSSQIPQITTTPKTIPETTTIATANTSITQNSSSTTKSQDEPVGVDTDDSEDDSSIPLEVYLKKGEQVTINNYDYKFTLPMDEDNTALYTSYSAEGSTKTYLPPKIAMSQLKDNTCFLSDKVLALDKTTDVFVAIRHVDVSSNSSTSNSSRSKRSAADPGVGDYIVNYTMSIISSQCRFWDPNINDWNTEGLEVGPLTDSTTTHCISTILSVSQNQEQTTLPVLSTTTPAIQYTSSKKYNPFGGISFSASFENPFNAFDPLDTSGWSNLSENPLIFSVMISLWSLYLCCLIWARRWDLKDEVMAGASPLLDNDPSDSYLYELTVFTSSRRGAGTTAKVSMIFAGLDEETAPRLIFDDKRPVLQSGGIDSFLMSVPRHLGPLNHIRVWHDNSGKNPSWHFAYMCVVDLITKDKYYFVCDNWLSVGDGDGAIDRMVPIATHEDLTNFSHLFWTKARKDLTDSHIWFSVFGRPPKSVFTRVQRVTCCLTLLFCGMCANILLYKEGLASSGAVNSFKIGPISLTLDEIKTGILGSLLVFPINLIIVYIFRNSKHRQSAVVRGLKKRSADYKKNDGFDEMASANNAKSTANMDKEGQAKKKSKCSLNGFLFPWWFQGIAYFLCLACNAISFWITVQMGFSFGADKAERWMISFVTSFIESLLLSQPIKVVLFAMFYALVIKSPTIEDELDNDPGLLQGEEYLHNRNASYNAEYIQLQKSLARYKVLPVPPQPEYIAAAKKKKQKEDEMQGVLREILAYVIFLYLLYAVSYGSKESITWRMYRNQQNALEFGLHEPYGPMKEGPGYTFSKPLPMSLVGSLESFWTWCETNYIPFMYSSVDYGGYDLPASSTMDGINYLVGTTRLRQLRVNKVSCPAVVYKYEKHCAKAMSAYNADRGEYGLKWTKVKDGEEAEDGFKYQNATALEGLPTRGLAGYYEGGGYAYTLGRSQASAFKSISHLKENDWIDEHTRAIFVEFTIFNNQLNLFTSSFIIFEMMPTGALYPKFKVLPFRLERYRGNNALMTLLSELGMIAYTIYFFVKEIKLMKKQKKEYFKDFWNVVEFLMLLMMLAAIAMIFYRFYLLVETSARKQAVKEDRQKYVSFDYAALFEESYLFLLAFISFVATVKFLKLLRFNKKMNVLGHTLLYIARPFVSFMFTMLMVFVAYSHMAFLVFNTLLLSFSSFTSSMSTLFTLMLNKFDYKSMERANPLFAPFIFLTFTVVMGFMLINFMLSLIIEGFTSVNADLEGKPNKYEIVDFVIGKFKAVLGFGSDTMPAVRDKKEDFIEDSQKELDMKFGEFSERVFGMFLQDVEDIKDMKAAENLINRERRQRQRKKILYS